MAYWLLKTEPEEYSYSDLATAGRGRWDGVRGIQALRNIRRIAPGDLAFIYHTGKQKAIVGIAEVAAGPYPDPAADDEKLLVFDLIPRAQLAQPVSLQTVKSWPELAEWELVRQPRLSVMPVPELAWQMIMTAANAARG